MWKFIRFGLLGAILAVALSGTLGADVYIPDAFVAVLGGLLSTIAVKLSLIA